MPRPYRNVNLTLCVQGTSAVGDHFQWDGLCGQRPEGENDMKIEGNRQFDAAMALAHVTDAIRGETLSNGAPAADALFSALEHDAREAGLGLDAIAALDWERLFNAGFHVAWALENGNHEFVLPFGTPAKSDTPGAVEIAGRHLVVDADRPGLHPLETTSPAAGGRNLELLHRLIAKKTANLACRRIGLPQPSQITDADSRHLLHFPPFEGAAGVVLQRWATETGAARFRAAPRKTIERFADSIVKDMRALWKNRAAVGARVEEVRQAALAGIATAEGRGREVGIDKICVDMRLHREGDTRFCLYLEYAGCDEALRQGRILEFVPGRDDLDERGLWRRPCTHDWRLRDLAELQAMGANGRIESIAAEVARLAPEGVPAVLARLARDLETQVVVETNAAPIYATLYWRDGRIESEVSQANAFDVHGGSIEVKPVARTGRGEDAFTPGDRVGAFVTLPMAHDAQATSVSELHNGGMRLKFDRTYLLVNVDTGEIRPEPQGVPQES